MFLFIEDRQLIALRSSHKTVCSIPSRLTSFMTDIIRVRHCIDHRDCLFNTFVATSFILNIFVCDVYLNAKKTMISGSVYCDVCSVVRFGTTALYF